jgi:hypothetical protein
LETLAPGLVVGESEAVQKFCGLGKFEWHVQDPASQHVGDSDIAGWSSEVFRHDVCIGIRLLTVIDDGDERASSWRQGNVADTRDLSSGLEV